MSIRSGDVAKRATSSLVAAGYGARAAVVLDRRNSRAPDELYHLSLVRDEHNV